MKAQGKRMLLKHWKKNAPHAPTHPFLQGEGVPAAHFLSCHCHKFPGRAFCGFPGTPSCRPWGQWREAAIGKDLVGIQEPGFSAVLE